MTVIKSLQKAFNYWWLFLLIGILLVALSVAILVRPLEGLLGFTMFLGFSSMFTGIGQIYLSLKNKTSLNNWGWYLWSGVLEFAVGAGILIYPQISLAILPVLISFWLIVRGFALIGIAVAMKKFDLRKSRWVLIGGILSLLFVLFILLNPMAATIGLMIWIGLSILFAGIASIIIAFGIREINEEINDDD
ncbi:HdeD family acid-resistance protein [Crocinitomix catalasitica]|uniref:HdeD family acid-resistance protein n=1 Tax=Crocinitomix catalasitica TaxID=184607 RepID=UPI00048163B3|nr:DUF308 domain-containing protein [Crocinitomix catalasitica]